MKRLSRLTLVLILLLVLALEAQAECKCILNGSVYDSAGGTCEGSSSCNAPCQAIVIIDDEPHTWPGGTCGQPPTPCVCNYASGDSPSKNTTITDCHGNKPNCDSSCTYANTKKYIDAVKSLGGVVQKKQVNKIFRLLGSNLKFGTCE
ncbi:MAG: hypothetical protein H6619_01035 [Deltaproteobacteria bacterium]|nr:hypothetical protein [Deltaproteobacteria bacterium]